MKKIFAAAPAVFSLVLAGCPTPENKSPEPEIQTTLTIKNQSFSDLADVKWDSDFFADKEDNILSISSSVKKNVHAGTSTLAGKEKSAVFRIGGQPLC